MIHIIDTYAWIEYFIGSTQGKEVEKYLTDRQKTITMECCLGEVYAYCLKNGYDFSSLKDTIISRSVIHPVLREHWIKAAKIRYESRKKIKHFGMIDAILVAKQQELNCKIISGDPHFRTMKDVVFLK